MTSAAGPLGAAAAHAASAASCAPNAPIWMPSWLAAGWPADYLPPLIALAAFVLSLCVFVSAKRRERFKLGIDLIMKLGERFETPAMRQHRAAAAIALRKGSQGEIPGLNAVLDFFEEIAFLERRGAIDLEAVYEFFAFWIEVYARASAEYRAARREDDDMLVWEGFEDLWKDVEEFDHWATSKDVPRWQPYVLHNFMWRHGHGRDLSKSWSATDQRTDSDLHQEQLQLDSVLPGAWRPRRMKHSGNRT